MVLFSLGTIVSPKRNWKQCLCKIWGDKQRVLWYFLKWPIGETVKQTKSQKIPGGGGVLVISLRGVHFGFWSHLRCSRQNAIKCSREGLVFAREELEKYLLNVLNCGVF